MRHFLRNATLLLGLVSILQSSVLLARPSRGGQQMQPNAEGKTKPTTPTSALPASATPANAAKPEITKPTASSGAPKTRITITGTGFDPIVGQNNVKFGETEAPVISATATTIITTVPPTLKAGKTSVTVTTKNGGISNAWPFSVGATSPKLGGPEITSLSPLSGSPGSEVVLAGTSFGTKGTVKFNGAEAAVSGAWADKSLTVIVPQQTPHGAVSVTVATAAGVSKNSQFTVVAPTVWYGVVSGDFSPFITAGKLSAIHVSVLNQDFQVVGEATSSGLSPTDSGKLEIFYTQIDPKAVPAWVLIGKTNPGDHQYPFTPMAKPGGVNPNVAMFKQVIAGDFCLRDNTQCSTGLITLDANGKPVTPPNPAPKQIAAYVQSVDGTSEKTEIGSIGLDTVDVSFSAVPDFKAAWLVLSGNAGARRFVYTPAPPVVESDLVYTGKDLETICDTEDTNCSTTPAEHIVLKPVASDSTATFLAVHELLLTAHIRGPLGSEPTAILVTNTSNKPPTSVIVRRTIKPGENNELLNVDMSIMDQVTAQRNYGNRIAKRYIAVTLDVKNPTSKKIQFNKSALYFDVDYIEAKERGPSLTGFVQAIGEVSTLGLYQPSVYEPPFVAARNEPDWEKNEKNNAKDKRPRVARFGLEQNAKQAPENYLAVLGSFDYTTQKTDDKLKAIELVGGILTTIATGGIVADASGAFKAGTAIFSGTFLPGVRGIVLDTSFINRLRANLVAQTFQETVLVPANGSATTVVLLPRAGILAFTDAEVSVMIDRVIDVHLIPEVVSDVSTATTVQKGACKVGYTKDQTRDALGEPVGVATNADGSSVFTYPTGPEASASFNAAGSLVSCQPRSVSDQLAQATTLVVMNQTLTNLSLPVNKITLTDGSVVLTDIPGVTQSFHFDSTGKKATDYTFLFAKIKAYQNQSKSGLDSFLEVEAKVLSTSRSEKISTEANGADKDKTTTATYDSPDIQNGKIVITFDNKAGSVLKGSNVKEISFSGDKPQGVM
jgi:hypothetical protein